MKAGVRTIERFIRGNYRLSAFLLISLARAQSSNFHDAPASARQLKNPYADQPPANGKASIHIRCARCHGENGEGSGNIPPLAEQKIKAVTPGEIFWFITKGDEKNGMPSWAKLPQRQRWLIVNYAKTLGTAQASQASAKAAVPEKAV